MRWPDPFNKSDQMLVVEQAAMGAEARPIAMVCTAEILSRSSLARE